MVLLFMISFFLPFAEGVEGVVHVPAHYYYGIVSVDAPFQLSYEIEVVGGSQAGHINIFLVDQANYNKIAAKDLIPSHTTQPGVA